MLLRLRYGLLSCFLGLSLAQAQAQLPPTDNNPTDTDNDVQYIIENAVEAADGEEFTFDTQFENLEELLRNPLDLNRASEQTLAQSGLFSAMQIQALLEYRRRYGQIFSLYELAAIPTFDRTSIYKILPYVSVQEAKAKEKFNAKRWLRYGKHQTFGRYRRVLEQAKGFSDLALGETGTRYQGNPDQYYLRYRYTYKDRLSWGVTMEKDPGEAFFRGANKRGFDFYSAHLWASDLNDYIKTLAIGDYQVFLGQGLTMWGGFGIRKSPNVLNIKRVTTPIRAYTSANEALFLRGAAAQLQFKKVKGLDLVLFASYRRRDGNIQTTAVNDSILIDSLGQDTESGFIDEVSSLPEAGLHRTPTEISQKNQIGMFNTGGSLRYRGSNWVLGANLSYFRFDKPLNLGSSLYQAFWFKGQQLLNVSLDYTYIYKNLQFFGETALSSNGGAATINGLLMDLDPKLKAVALYRNYGRNYQNLLGNAFGETQQTSNESGFYTGLEFYPASGWKISMFADVYRFPWLRYLVDAPSSGYEFFGKADYQINRRWSIYVQYRFEERERNLSNNTTPLDVLAPTQRQSLRFHAAYNLSSEWQMRSRIEFSGYRQASFSRGMVLYQDLAYRPKNLPMTFNARFAVFDTDNYDTRIYAYENDMLYQFSVPAYYGRGSRFYLNWHWKVRRNVSFWLRFSQTYFSDRDVISSGLGEIEGSRRSEIKAQIRVQW